MRERAAGQHRHDTEATARVAAAVVVAVAMRPGLWPTAVRQVLRLAPRGWWRKWPPVPRPDPGWMAFRLRTAYGDGHRRPEPHDVVAWLDWCRDHERLRYSRRR